MSRNAEFAKPTFTAHFTVLSKTFIAISPTTPYTAGPTVEKREVSATFSAYTAHICRLL